MSNELERFLDLATNEAGYAPDFFRLLLQGEFYALIPAVGHGLGEGKIRFVMWSDPHGAQVIPCFASNEAVRRALKPGWQAVKVRGRNFLESTRGATVVLNPNEPANCRLSPEEITLLLETGAISRPESFTPPAGSLRSFQAVATPPAATLHSLSVLFSRHASVHRAYLVFCSPPDRPEERCYLVGLRMEDRDTERLVRESAQVMDDVPPDRNMDLVTWFDDSNELLQLVAALTPPFYDRAWGARIVAPPSGTSI